LRKFFIGLPGDDFPPIKMKPDAALNPAGGLQRTPVAP
jgi:hypothetical protein